MTFSGDRVTVTCDRCRTFSQLSVLPSWPWLVIAAMGGFALGFFLGLATWLR